MAASVAPERSGHQVADEGDRDDDRTRRDHRDGDGVEELPLRQPAELVHHAAVQERHDGESAAEHEGAGLGEVPRDLPEPSSGAGPCSPVTSHGHDGQRGRRGRRPAQQVRGEPDDAAEHEQPDDLRLGPRGDERAHDEDRPEQPVAARACSA